MNKKKTDLQCLATMIKDIKFTMMTTSDESGAMFSRPMANQKIDAANFDGDLWFFTKLDSPKVFALNQDHHVNLAYADTDKQNYVSVCGMARISTDKEKMKELWNPTLKAWFPEGLLDPQIALICVSVHSAELWDSPPSKVVQLVGMAKAIVTGKPMDHSMTSEIINVPH